MKQYDVFDYFVALLVFVTIMASITKVNFIRNILYYILWLTIIFEFFLYSDQISELLKPLSGVK